MMMHDRDYDPRGFNMQCGESSEHAGNANGSHLHLSGICTFHCVPGGSREEESYGK
jgi:hypothetical protein